MFCIRRKDILLFKIVHLTYYAIKRGKKKEKEKESSSSKSIHYLNNSAVQRPNRVSLGKNTGNNEKWCTVSRTNITFQERYKKLCSIPGLTVPKILSSRSASHGGEPAVIV